MLIVSTNLSNGWITDYRLIKSFGHLYRILGYRCMKSI